VAEAQEEATRALKSRHTRELIHTPRDVSPRNASRFAHASGAFDRHGRAGTRPFRPPGAFSSSATCHGVAAYPRRGAFGKSLIDNPAHLARICATSAKAIEQACSRRGRLRRKAWCGSLSANRSNTNRPGCKITPNKRNSSITHISTYHISGIHFAYACLRRTRKQHQEQLLRKGLIEKTTRTQRLAWF
jgi:hypothetical protein